MDAFVKTHSGGSGRFNPMRFLGSFVDPHLMIGSGPMNVRGIKPRRDGAVHHNLKLSFPGQTIQSHPVKGHKIIA